MIRMYIVVATLFALPATASADIYKCRLANGKTEISNAPCPSGSGTVTARPDERVSEASRRAAEQDVERMRNFVEKREAVQRAEESAEREQQRAANQQSRNDSANRAPRQYGNTDDCLRNVGQMVLEASQRAQMEADCRNLINPQPVPAPVVVPMPIYPQPHHHHPQSAHPPKAEPPSAPKISVQPLKK